MTVGDLCKRVELELAPVAAAGHLEKEVRGCYVCDLLSDVVAHAAEGQVWVTLQTHVNVVAVAALKDVAAIILVNGRSPGPEAAAKAEEERIPILSTPLSAFAVAGGLYALGLGR
jgi:predicted transcriptional regulator